MTRHLSVTTASADYPVLFAPISGEESSTALARVLKGSPCALVTDSRVGPLYAAQVQAVLQSCGSPTTIIEVAAGEPSKSLGVVEDVCNRMTAAGLDRTAVVVALGGGVVGDLAGFCAAIYFRGIPCIQIPTTIVSQVDSSVGGKTGVNTTAGKNLLGAFQQPALVLIDVRMLDTLPPREFNEGFAEVIKHGVIRDESLIDAVHPLDRTRLPEIIERNVQIKAAIVAGDERETTGTRALLNFGHTIGHAIESAAGYGTLLHGEAVSLGITAALFLSERHCGLDSSATAKVLAALRGFNLPVRLPGGIPDAPVLAAMKSDKKFQRGRICFVLTPALGTALVSADVTESDLQEALAHLRAG